MQVRSGVAGLGSTRGEEAAAAAVRLEESRQDFDGAPVETPDGCVASEVCFARAVREPARGRHLSVTTSHGPPGVAAITITRQCRTPASVMRPVHGVPQGSCSPLEDVLMLTELREAVLQWLPCCDLCRARRVSRRFFAWADSALAAQRSPAVICNTKRDYSGLNLVQQLDPRQCAFTPVGLATTAAPAADDCAQVGGHVYALRGSVLHVAELPAADSETTARAPSSPVFEPMSSPERSPRGLNHSPPRTARPTAKLVGMPTSPSERLRMSSKLIWNEALRIPIPGVGKQSFDHLRVGGRLCVGQDGALLVVGGGVEQDIGQPPVVPLGRHDVDAIRAAAEAAAAAVARDRASLSVTAQVLRVDPSKGLWQRLPNLLEPRRDCVVAKLENGALLVAGGSGTHGALASAEVFHPDVSDMQTYIYTRTRI